MTELTDMTELPSTDLEETLPESFVISSTLHPPPLPAAAATFKISTGADVAPEQLSTRRSAAPPSALVPALFVSGLALLVAAGGAVALYVA